MKFIRYQTRLRHFSFSRMRLRPIRYRDLQLFPRDRLGSKYTNEPYQPKLFCIFVFRYRSNPDQVPGINLLNTASFWLFPIGIVFSPTITWLPSMVSTLARGMI